MAAKWINYLQSSSSSPRACAAPTSLRLSIFPPQCHQDSRIFSVLYKKCLQNPGETSDALGSHGMLSRRGECQPLSRAHRRKADPDQGSPALSPVPPSRTLTLWSTSIMEAAEVSLAPHQHLGLKYSGLLETGMQVRISSVHGGLSRGWPGAKSCLPEEDWMGRDLVMEITRHTGETGREVGSAGAEGQHVSSVQMLQPVRNRTLERASLPPQDRVCSVLPTLPGTLPTPVLKALIKCNSTGPYPRIQKQDSNIRHLLPAPPLAPSRSPIPGSHPSNPLPAMMCVCDGDTGQSF
ncbi:uncharacterized protein LOC119087906 [Peromyscus leucopus]|uniref:uncharacterized protein LOC119087906 n=1 Tax=Peromyscus leucopus TaxID=10041 RepID=UPI0018852691|nr:uncharacterized protein LOC119087906 [Peromyscus leucopus]